MNRRRVVCVLALVSFVTGVSFADIGENFQKAGIGLAGSVSFENNFYYFTDSTDDRKFWSLDVSPEVDYYVADRVGLSLAPWVYYESYTADPDNIDRFMSFGARVGGYYAFVANPAAQQGLVLTLGGSIGLGFYPGLDDLVAGVELPNDSTRTDLLLAFTPRLYYYLNDRLAPFIGITPRLGYILSLKDISGTKVDLTSGERLYGRILVSMGMSWSIPNKKASLFLNK